MGDGIDTRLLTELTDQSQDLNSDAVRMTRQALGEYAQEEPGAARSARFGRSGRFGHGALQARGGLAVGLLGTGALLFGAGRARAAGSTPTGSSSANANDIMALQTAASIENLAVSVYTAAAGLPFIKTGNPTVAEFISKTTAQHAAHATAFNAAIAHAGGKEQHGVDPKYAAMLQSQLPNIKNAGDVVAVAVNLEDVAAQTYTKYVGEVTTPALRTLFGSVAPVEAQHRSVLLAVQALLNANDEGLVAIPTQPDKLPAAAGSVPIPDAFYPTTNASPISEGAVQ